MTTFSFQITEEMLHSAIKAMGHHPKTANQELMLQVSVDLVPDGVGYEAFNPRMDIITHEIVQETVVPQLFYDAFGEGEQ